MFKLSSDQFKSQDANHVTILQFHWSIASQQFIANSKISTIFAYTVTVTIKIQTSVIYLQ